MAAWFSWLAASCQAVNAGARFPQFAQFQWGPRAERRSEIWQIPRLSLHFSWSERRIDGIVFGLLAHTFFFTFFHLRAVMNFPGLFSGHTKMHRFFAIFFCSAGKYVTTRWSRRDNFFFEIKTVFSWVGPARDSSRAFFTGIFGKSLRIVFSRRVTCLLNRVPTWQFSYIKMWGWFFCRFFFVQITLG